MEIEERLLRLEAQLQRLRRSRTVLLRLLEESLREQESLRRRLAIRAVER